VIVVEGTGAPKTVWILGAGFSQSLGGPLLDDLFRSDPDVGLFFPDEGFPGLAQTITDIETLFQWGMRVENRWSNAEDFLAFVDDASSDSASGASSGLFGSLLFRARTRSLLGEWAGKPHFTRSGDTVRFLVRLPSEVRRALAAECSRFLLDPDLNSERWLPYQEWAGSLVPGANTVISFIYDLGLETLSPSKFFVPLPSEAQTLPEMRVPVLKLHGSVNWSLANDACARAEHPKILADTNGQIAIAAPGRSKKRMIDDVFRPLWEVAKQELKRANAIIFLGYSFPKSDAKARHELLSAIREDECGTRLRRFDIVLGHDVKQPQTQRMLALLQACSKGRGLPSHPAVEASQPSRGDSSELSIVLQPLWVEDYISDYAARFCQDHWCEQR
jgi:hypothetical protein